MSLTTSPSEPPGTSLRPPTAQWTFVGFVPNKKKDRRLARLPGEFEAAH